MSSGEQTAEIKQQHPMWCDNFDMDLLKIIPELPQLLGDAAHIQMFTHGATRYGRLNHPTMWNSSDGMICFFGLHGPAKPEQYVSFGPIISCTWLEALRDLWVHPAVMYFEQKPVWNSWALQEDFTRLLYHRRTWKLLPPGEEESIVKRVRNSILCATITLQAIRDVCRQPATES
jgi:hypothetical protein